MTTPTNYIATWFYKESKEDASFYPQAGKRGDSALVHSIYMQIQVPFFTTFRHYHPNDKLLFFSNLDQFPDYLERLFKELRIETVTLPYLCIPPKGWYGHGEINSICMISCAIWRKGCRRTIRCSSAMRTVSVCVRWGNYSATHGNTVPPCTMHPTDRTSK